MDVLKAHGIAQRKQFQEFIKRDMRTIKIFKNKLAEKLPIKIAINISTEEKTEEEAV